MKIRIGSLLAGLVVLVASCSGPEDDFCKKQKDCLGGNDKDEQACLEGTEGEREVANEYDCEDEYEKALECAANNARCVTVAGAKDFTTEDPDTGSDPCGPQFSAYQACVTAASAIIE